VAVPPAVGDPQKSAVMTQTPRTSPGWYSVTLAFDAASIRYLRAYILSISGVTDSKTAHTKYMIPLSSDGSFPIGGTAQSRCCKQDF
jgi:hypothetical protein